MAIITTSNLKTFLGITDTTDDTTLGYAVNAANSAVVQYCGRSFDLAGSVSDRKFPSHGCETVWVDDIATTTGLVVTTDTSDDGTYATTWVLDTDFYLEPVNQLVDGVTWPYTRLVGGIGSYSFNAHSRRPYVKVTAKWGWSAVPDPVFEATLIKAARLWKRKDSVNGIMGVDAFGPVRITRMQDPDVVDLLDPYSKITGFA